MTPLREAIIIRAIELHASTYQGPHAVMQLGAARYIAEGHLKDEQGYGASREEWDWIAQYIEAHPGILENKPLTMAELDARNAADREQAEKLSGEARRAFNAGDSARALELIDQAHVLFPGNAQRWDQIREHIRSV